MNSSERYIGEFNPDHPQFRKIPCRHWQRGSCYRGDHCNFLHEHACVREMGTRTPSPRAEGSEQLKIDASISTDYVVVDLSPRKKIRPQWKRLGLGAESD